MVGGKLRVDNADDEGMFCCARGESASDVSPKVGNSVRCLLVFRWDMEVFIPNSILLTYRYWGLYLWLFTAVSKCVAPRRFPKIIMFFDPKLFTPVAHSIHFQLP